MPPLSRTGLCGGVSDTASSSPATVRRGPLPPVVPGSPENRRRSSRWTWGPWPWATWSSSRSLSLVGRSLIHLASSRGSFLVWDSGRAGLRCDREHVGVKAQEVGQGALGRGERSQAGGHRWLGFVFLVVVEGVLVAFPGSPRPPARPGTGDAGPPHRARRLVDKAGGRDRARVESARTSACCR
jgi:hypothetical protein